MKPKVLPINNLESIEELVYQYLEKNDFLQYANLQKVMANMRSSLMTRRSIVLVDDINDPTCFYWATFVIKPTLFTEMKEAISMAGWADNKDQIESLLDSLKRKVKMRGVENLFINESYPFSLCGEEGEVFEKIKQVKL